MDLGPAVGAAPGHGRPHPARGPDRGRRRPRRRRCGPAPRASSPDRRCPARPLVRQPKAERPALADRRPRGSGRGGRGWLGCVVWQSQQAPTAPPVTQAGRTPAPPPTTLATPTPPPVTVAPAPPPVEASGRAGRGSVRAAQAAFDRGDYDRAVAEARQGAAARTRGTRNALQILDQARAGQQARAPGPRGRRRARSRRLRRRPTGRPRRPGPLAPWVGGRGRPAAKDRRGRARGPGTGAVAARRRRSTRFLNQAATALQNKQYEAAIDAYERVLDLDPTNAAAQPGQAGGDQRRRRSPTPPRAGRSPGAGRRFVAGRTEAKGTRAGRPRRVRGLGRGRTSRRAPRPPSCPARSSSRRAPRLRSRATASR